MKRCVNKLLSCLLCFMLIAGLLSVSAWAEASVKLSETPVVEYYGRSALAALDNSEALLYAYDAMTVGIGSAAEEIVLYDGVHPLSSEEMQTVLDACIRDHAEYFWLGNSYSYTQTTTSVYALVPSYLFTGDALTAAQAEFEEAVEEMLGCVNDSMSEFEIELALHDALAKHITYVDVENSHNAYGALINGQAVCEGYAEALQVLLHRCGIQSFLATGVSLDPGSGSQVGHEWNFVRIDGNYYHVDVTWDDQEDVTYHAYFNQPDAVMLTDHALDTTAYALPVCTATEKNYHEVKGGKFDTYTVDAVANHLKNNDLQAMCYIPGDVNAFLTWFGNNIREIAASCGVSGSFSYGTAVLGHEVRLSIEKTVNILGQGTCGDNLTWKLDEEGTLTISGTGKMNGNPWSAYAKNIKNVVLPEGLTSIYSCAFMDCVNLEDVVVPDSVTSMGSSAFRGCYNLKSLTLPFVGEDKYSNKFLGYLFGASNTSNNGWYVPSSLQTVTLSDKCTDIGYRAFYGCTFLENVTIGDGVTSIGGGAFENCVALTNVTMGSAVTIIDSSAFSGCEKMQNITIPDGVTLIGSYAFSNCASLTSMTIPDGVTTIGTSAFYNCTNLTGITLPSGLTYIDDALFAGCKSLSAITIPNGVTTIGGSAFRGCTSLTSVVIPDGVTIIGDAAFEGCAGIKNVVIPAGVTELYSYVFSGCTGLNSVTIPNGITSIGNYAFSSCTGLSEITIPDSVTQIGEYAFASCTSLKNLVIPKNVTSIGQEAFSQCSGLVSVQFAGTITSIGNAAFAYCTGLTSVVIPDGVTVIGNSAFRGCSSLVCITIPASVTSIGWRAFEHCDALWHVLHKGTQVQWEAISIGTFNTCLLDATRHHDCVGDEIASSEDKNCTICGAICEHVWTQTSVIQEPTCTETGTALFVCSHCGEESTQEIEAKGHSWEGATCTRPTTCTYCGDTMGTAIGHREVTDEAVAPTCTESGLTEGKHCFVCNEVLVVQSVVNALGHDYDAVVTAPTCTAGGFTTYTCANCGDSYTGDPVSALGHTEVIDEAAAATCTENGLTEGKHCSVCNEVLVAQNVVEKISHTWQAATCTEPKTCSACGATEGIALGHSWINANCTTAKHCVVCQAKEGVALGHDWQSATCTTPKTCPRCGTTEGKALGHDWTDATCTEPKTCKTCGTTVGEKLGHNWADATCTEVKTCKTCGTTEGEKLGHNWQNATCTEAKICLNCGATEGEALGHSYGPWLNAGENHGKSCGVCGWEVKEEHAWDAGRVTQEAEEYRDGEMLYTCTICGAEKKQIIPSLGHEHNYTEAVTEPTCVAAGYTTYTCGCGNSYTEPGAPAFGHAYLTEETKPTCTEAGYTTHTCSVCGDCYTDGTVDALGHELESAVTAPDCLTDGFTTHTCVRCGHSYVDTVTEKLGHREASLPGKAPTCTESGLTEGSQCAVCGQVIVAQTKIAATGHQFGSWVITKEPTAEEAGLQKRTCAACQAEEAEEIPATGPVPTEPTEPPTEPTEPLTSPTSPTEKPTQPGGLEPQNENHVVMIMVVVILGVIGMLVLVLLIFKKKR